MKKYLFITMAAVVAAAIVSCNPDNEVNGGDETPTVKVFETTDATTVCINEMNGNDNYKGIELYNPTDAEVSLVGWKIVKNNEEALYWEGVDGDKIAAKGYFVIKANKKTAEIDAVANAMGTGGLSAAKIVKLDLLNGSIIVDTFDRGFTALYDGVNETALPAMEGSAARVEDGKKTWKVMTATFGATNKGAQVIGEVTVDPE